MRRSLSFPPKLGQKYNVRPWMQPEVEAEQRFDQLPEFQEEHPSPESEAEHRFDQSPGIQEEHPSPESEVEHRFDQSAGIQEEPPESETEPRFDQTPGTQSENGSSGIQEEPPESETEPRFDQTLETQSENGSSESEQETYSAVTEVPSDARNNPGDNSGERVSGVVRNPSSGDGSQGGQNPNAGDGQSLNPGGNTGGGGLNSGDGSRVIQGEIHGVFNLYPENPDPGRNTGGSGGINSGDGRTRMIQGEIHGVFYLNPENPDPGRNTGGGGHLNSGYGRTQMTQGVLNSGTTNTDTGTATVILVRNWAPPPNDPPDSLKHLWVFGFSPQPYLGFSYVLFVLVMLAVLAGAIPFGNLQLHHPPATVFLCVFLPLVCCALPPVALMVKVMASQGIRRYLEFPVNGNGELAMGFWISVLSEICILVLFEALWLVFSSQHFTWRFIKFVFWSFVTIIHIVSLGVILMRIKRCKRDTSELNALLGTVLDSTTTDLSFKVERIGQLRQLETSFSSLSRGISAYISSLLIVLVVPLCASIAIFYQRHYNEFEDKDNGAYRFVYLSLIQGITVWSLLGMCNGLNSGFKDLAHTAHRVYTNADMTEQYQFRVLAGLKLVADEVKDSRVRISVFCSKVDAAMMFSVFGIHLTFVALTVGSYMTSFFSKPLK